MKVAAVFWAPNPTEGGMYAFVESIFGALRKVAHESRHEFVYYAPGVNAGAGDVHTIPTTGFALHRRVGGLLRDTFSYSGFVRQAPRTWFERSLAQQDIDLVWFTTPYALRCDPPFVFTIFDIEYARQPWFPEVSARGLWEQRDTHYSDFVRKATCVVVPNAAGRDQVDRYFRIEPERILCLGHPTPSFARDAAKRQRLSRERIDAFGIRGRYLLYPAQYWPHKNHATLFDALSELARGSAPYELVLVGSDKGGQLAHVQTLARRAGITELVHFLGFVETDDLVALYQHAHALTYRASSGPRTSRPSKHSLWVVRSSQRTYPARETSSVKPHSSFHRLSRAWWPMRCASWRNQRYGPSSPPSLVSAQRT